MHTKSNVPVHSPARQPATLFVALESGFLIVAHDDSSYQRPCSLIVDVSFVTIDYLETQPHFLLRCLGLSARLS